MNRVKPNHADKLGIAQDWSLLQPGELVDVTDATGYRYAAYIEAKTEQSDIVWIRVCIHGTRQLLHYLDGTNLVPVANQPHSQ